MLLLGREPTSAEARVRALFDDHFDVVWRTLRRLGLPAAAADDAAQEVFLVAARKVDSIERGRERSFLVGTAIRVAANARRSRDAALRDDHVEVDDMQLSSEETLPDAQLEARRTLALLDRALGQLPEDLRTVLVLTELDALTQPETATLLRLPLGTVASRVRRARHELAQKVNLLRDDLAPRRRS